MSCGQFRSYFLCLCILDGLYKAAMVLFRCCCCFLFHINKFVLINCKIKVFNEFCILFPFFFAASTNANERRSMGTNKKKSAHFLFGNIIYLKYVCISPRIKSKRTIACAKRQMRNGIMIKFNIIYLFLMFIGT